MALGTSTDSQSKYDTTNSATVQTGNKICNYDDFVDVIGEFGLWQKFVCFLLWFPAAAGGIHVLMYSFTGLAPDKFRCDIPGCISTNYSGYQWDDEAKTQSCSYYEAARAEDGRCVETNTGVVKTCTQGPYIFQDFEFDETTVTRFNILCANEHPYKNVAFTGAMYMIGLFIGSFLFGFISDKFGRKIAMLGCILVSSSGSLAGSFMPDYWSYMALRVVTASGSVGLFNEAFTMTVELMGSKEIVPWLPWLTYKNLLGNTIQMPYAVGEMVLGVIAIFIRDYVTLQWVMSAICFIQVPLWLLMPESPRWLMSKGRLEEAKVVMERAARWNKKTVDLSALRQEDEKDEMEERNELGLMDLFRTKDMFIITLVMFFNWPIITMGYFGLGLSMTQLGGNIFVEFILGAAVEIPGYLLCALLIDVWGRKPFFVCCLLVTGVSCTVAGLLEEGALRTTIALLGKLFAAGNFSVVYMYTAEIYPTVIRQTAIGSCSMVARIGGIAAPYIALYLPTIDWTFAKKLPMLIMGISSILGGLLAFCLPETLGSSLPEKMDDVKEMKKNAKPLCSCVNPKTLP